MQNPKADVRATAGGAVFQARGLTKIYRMGEVQVRALRGVEDRKSVV